MSTHQTLVRSARLLGALTFVSRVLGFFRDVLIARFFGTGIQAEAFVVSFKIPNLFRDLAGEGAMNAAIVPVLAETRHRSGEAEFRRLCAALLSRALPALALLALCGAVFAPALVRLAAPGFAADAEKFALTAGLTRLMFPFIFLVGMSALLMGILNSIGVFASSAFGPILLNASMIVSFFLLERRWGVKGIAIGVLAGGVLQCAAQLVSFRGRGIGFPAGFPAHEGVRRIARLLGPRIWGSAVYQVSVFVDTILASFYWIVGAGGQSALYYASRLFQLPLAIFGVSFAQAALPTLSGHATRGDLAAFRGTVAFSLAHVIFMTVPAAIGLGVFSDTIIAVLFERGAFTDESTRVTSGALFFYAWGLCGCAAAKLLSNAFYALQDTMTPVRTAFAALLANVVLNLALMWKMKIGGLALATSVSTTLNALLLYRRLGRRVGAIEERHLTGAIARAAGAGAAMGALGFFLFKPWVGAAAGQAEAALRLGAAVASSGAVYLAASWIIGSPEARDFWRLVPRAERAAATRNAKKPA